MDLFKELIPSLLRTKEYIYDENDSFSPYVLNVALSHYLDCVLFVNEMNKLPNLDQKMQYDFYYHTLRKKNRPFNKWIKKDVSDTEILNSIKLFYNVSTTKAKEILNILTPNQKEEILNKTRIGGK